MPVFVEDPAHLSKSRLKSDLVAHNVELPPAKSKKEVYVKLHLKHIDQRNAADFSSDEEDRGPDGAEESAEDAVMPDPSGLTDEDLKAALLAHGVKAGPIVASTRALYEKKLSKLLQADGHNHLNGAEKGVLYSDSEEEEESGEEDAESGTEDEKQETLEQSDQAQQESSQLPLEPEKDIQKDVFPDAETTPTGIYATRRRPIRGAAGRPIRHVYPDTPVSPTTRERREAERCLVPVLLQTAVFLVVACILYLIYASLLDNSFNPFVALLDCLNQGLDVEEGLLLQAEAQDIPAPSGQE